MTRLKVVYKIDIGNHFYIGSSINYRRRKQSHFLVLKNNKHPNPILQNLYNKGYELKFTTLYESNNQLENIQNIEQEYIDKHFSDVNCINICDKVGGGAISKNPRENGLKSHATKLANGYYDNPTPISEEGKLNMSISAKNRLQNKILREDYTKRILNGQKKRWEEHNKNYILINEHGEQFGPYRLLIEPQTEGKLSRKSTRELYTGKKKKISGYTLKILFAEIIIPMV